MRASRLAILVAIAMAVATGARADASWTIGVKAGPSIASIGGDDANDQADSRAFLLPTKTSISRTRPGSSWLAWGSPSAPSSAAKKIV